MDGTTSDGMIVSDDDGNYHKKEKTNGDGVCMRNGQLVAALSEPADVNLSLIQSWCHGATGLGLGQLQVNSSSAQPVVKGFVLRAEG